MNYSSLVLLLSLTPFQWWFLTSQALLFLTEVFNPIGTKPFNPLIASLCGMLVLPYMEWFVKPHSTEEFELRGIVFSLRAVMMS